MANTFRELVAEVIKRYSTFANEVQKGQELLSEISQSLQETTQKNNDTQEKLERTQETLTLTQEKLNALNNTFKEIQAVQNSINATDESLKGLKENYDFLKDGINSFTSFLKEIKDLDLEPIIKTLLIQDKEVISDRVINEIFISGNIDTIIKALKEKVEFELETYEQLLAQAQGNYVLSLEFFNNAKREVQGYIKEADYILENGKATLIDTRIKEVNKLKETALSYYAKLEAVLNKTKLDFQNYADTKEAILRQIHSDIKTSIKNTQNLEAMFITNKSKAFLHNALRAIYLLHSAEVRLYRQDDLFTYTIRVHFDELSQVLFKELQKERLEKESFYKEQDKKIQDTLDTITILNKDIANKRNAILWLTLLKG